MLITAPTVEPVTLAEVKSQLGIKTADTDSDTQLTRRITEARKWAEGHMRRSLMPQTHEIRFDVFADEMELPFPPIASILSIRSTSMPMARCDHGRCRRLRAGGFSAAALRPPGL
ncbi:MAG: phage head-tail connector protein [Sulfuritalea sp.]|nr:phage head-tail connector protein [Sulfuritalea sp.]